MQFVDTHCHLDGEEFRDDLEAVITRAREAGVAAIGIPGINLQSLDTVIDVCHRYPNYCYPMLGLHPEDVKADWREVLERIKAAITPEVIAIGEVGLDYYWEDNPAREVQLACFEAQLELANDLSLPVVVHDRDAHEDTLRLLQKHRPRGVLHCYSGSAEMLREVPEEMYIGLGGAVTFKNAKKPVAVAAAVPPDRLLLETDAPYMAPVPYRGQRCDSSMIAHTAARIAEIRGMEAEELLARAVCHELDHLDGVLYVDKMDRELTPEEIEGRIPEDQQS
jgi:TatD DNase family protein